ncbi:MAG: ImmA/IrrE family metallo-endopeptidase [Pseudomonadota bacterium]
MQDKYTADVGDFGKYCLLHELCNQAGVNIRLGVNWFYVTRPETQNGDGNHVSYLSDESEARDLFRFCLPELYDKLKAIVRQNKRRIAEIEANKVLPKGSVFYSKPIPYSATTADERISLRRAWFEESLTHLSQADVVFLDPDNGIQTDSANKGQPGALKYVFTDEIEAYYRSGKSVIIYNHRDRRPRWEYEKKILANWEYVVPPGDIKVLRFKRVSVRDYIFLIQKKHLDIMNRTIERLTSTPCDFLFEQYSVEEGRAMNQRTDDWTHPSVAMLAANSDPIGVIVEKAKQVVLHALQEGWTGPPYDPFRLAGYLGVGVIPSSDVFDARTVSLGSNRFQIQYNPDKPRSRTRFSLAHEIAHTLFPDCCESVRHRLQIDKIRDDDWQMELLCNIAAAELLMPVGTGSKLEHESVTIDNLLRLQRQYDVSTEAIALRMANLTSEPCTIFVAARTLDQDEPIYRIDYSIPSRASTLKIPRGLLVRGSRLLSECIAIGFTAKGTEHWTGLPKVELECIGVAPYPNRRWPRIVGIARTHSLGISTGLRVTYLRGSALAPRGTGPRIIAHIVNDKTPNWGAGFPLALKKKWPDVQEDFRVWALSDRKNLSLGEIHATMLTGDLTIVHMVAQHGYGPSRTPRIRYSALKMCLDKLSSAAVGQSATVHMPRIGTGQAGGEWAVVADLIDDSLARRNIKVTVYDLPAASSVDRGQAGLGLFAADL